MCVWRKYPICKAFFRCFSTTQFQVLHPKKKTGWHFGNVFSLSSFHVTMRTTLHSGNLGRKKEQTKEWLSNPGRKSPSAPVLRMANFKAELGYSRPCTAEFLNIFKDGDLTTSLGTSLMTTPMMKNFLCPTGISHAATCDDSLIPFNTSQE